MAYSAAGPVYLEESARHLLVNILLINEVIPSVLQLVLEYGVHNKDRDSWNFVQKYDTKHLQWSEKVDEAIKNFVQDEEEIDPRGGWFKRNGSKYEKSYKEMDTATLMEIIPKVTNIYYQNKDPYHKMFKQLISLKDFRNKVIHNKNVTCCENTMSDFEHLVNSLLDYFGNMYNIIPDKLASFKRKYLKQIQDITNRNHFQANECKLMHQIQQSLLKECNEKWAQIVTDSMMKMTLPLCNTQVLLSAIFQESVIEVVSDSNKQRGQHFSDDKTFPCTNILSLQNLRAIDIIEGDPGSGKSTLLKKMCLEFCEGRNDSKFQSISDYMMMFHFNCREKFNGNSFWEYLKTVYPETADNFSEEWVIRALRGLKIIIAIDGLDECNKSSEKLVQDIIRNFSNSKTAKFLITTRPGFSKTVEEQFEFHSMKYRVLNIKPMHDIDDQKKFIDIVINQMPEFDKHVILNSFRNKQDELNSHFVHPIGLILFIILSHYFPVKIKQLSHDLDLMKLTFDLIKKNMSLRTHDKANSLDLVSLIMKMTGQRSLQWIHDKIYGISETIFTNLKCEIMTELSSENEEIATEDSVAGAIGCIFLQQNYTKTTAIYNFFHRSQQEYLASTVLTEKLKATRVGAVVEILSDLTKEDVKKEDLARLVF